jgi:hypothetical protein
MKKQTLVSASIIVAVLLIGVAMYYWYHQAAGRASVLVGDGICGSPLSAEAQDACCATAHEDDVTPQCVGGWKYVNGMKKCQYLCDGATPSCTLEVKSCRDREEAGRSER